MPAGGFACVLGGLGIDPMATWMVPPVLPVTLLINCAPDPKKIEPLDVFVLKMFMLALLTRIEAPGATLNAPPAAVTLTAPFIPVVWGLLLTSRYETYMLPIVSEALALVLPEVIVTPVIELVVFPWLAVADTVPANEF